MSDLERFERVARLVGKALDKRSFKISDGGTDTVGHWDALYRRIGAVGRLPAVTLYYGRFLDRRRRHFWVGFESKNLKSIEELVLAVRTNKTFQIATCRMNAANLDKVFGRLVKNRPQTVHETYANSWAWLGRYFFEEPLADQTIVAEAANFIDTVVDCYISAKRPFDRARDGYATRMIKERKGQENFKKRLMTVYNNRCAISGCAVEASLDAAHLVSHSGKGSYELSNGLLLRADLHKLLDRRLLKIDPLKQIVAISPEIKDKEYRSFDGKGLYRPRNEKDWPSSKALRELWLTAL
jgi:HNH endonuclease